MTTHAHTIAEAFGNQSVHRVICICGWSTGTCVSARQFREVWQAHANGTPIESPVRPLLLVGGAA